MPFLDSLQNAALKVLPEKKPTLQSASSGIGSSGAVPFEDDMIVSKPAIIFHVSQVFFNFLAMCTMAGAAAFQAKFKVGPSGLSGFAIFVAVLGIFYSLFILLVPVIYEKYDKGARLARALREIRVSFILSGAGTAVSLLLAFIVTISAWTEPGCKNPDRDPHADLGDDFKRGLSGFCSTKKAAAIFFWLVFIFWGCSLTLTILDWRNGKTSRPRDPPFTHPVEASDGSVYERAERDDEISDEEEGRKPYTDNYASPFEDSNRVNRFSGVSSTSVPSHEYQSSPPPVLPRQSFDTYGAFSDPPPTGFATYRAANDSQSSLPGVSRTMQYADPYAAVRASIGQPSAAPPSYSSDIGYR